jgi:hypothetical protein
MYIVPSCFIYGAHMYIYSGVCSFRNQLRPSVGLFSSDKVQRVNHHLTRLKNITCQSRHSATAVGSPIRITNGNSTLQPLIMISRLPHADKPHLEPKMSEASLLLKVRSNRLILTSCRLPSPSSLTIHHVRNPNSHQS